MDANPIKKEKFKNKDGCSSVVISKKAGVIIKEVKSRCSGKEATGVKFSAKKITILYENRYIKEKKVISYTTLGHNKSNPSFPTYKAKSLVESYNKKYLLKRLLVGVVYSNKDSFAKVEEIFTKGYLSGSTSYNARLASGMVAKKIVMRYKKGSPEERILHDVIKKKGEVGNYKKIIETYDRGKLEKIESTQFKGRNATTYDRSISFYKKGQITKRTTFNFRDTKKRKSYKQSTVEYKNNKPAKTTFIDMIKTNKDTVKKQVDYYKGNMLHQREYSNYQIADGDKFSEGTAYYKNGKLDQSKLHDYHSIQEKKVVVKREKGKELYYYNDKVIAIRKIRY